MDEKKLQILGVGAVVLLAMPLVASAVDLTGSFSGRADHSDGVPGSYTAGETYVAYEILDDATQQNPWFSWDPIFEYTLRISTTVTSFTSGSTQDIVFGPATVEIWADVPGYPYPDGRLGTAANFASKPTFTDGSLILSGSVSNMTGTRDDAFGLPYGVTGDVVLDGGASIGFLDSQCVGNMKLNDSINFQLPSGAWPDAQGYEEEYDSKFDCPDITTGTEDFSWGRIKAEYQ